MSMLEAYRSSHDQFSFSELYKGVARIQAECCHRCMSGDLEKKLIQKAYVFGV
jgi:hypothetical protein